MSSNAEPTGTVNVSVDVSKHSLDICILAASAGQSPSTGGGKIFAVSDDQAGIDSLLDQLRQSLVELVVLEASGRYERPVATALAAVEIGLAVVNPGQARDFAKATGRLTKTDRIDTETLARFAAAVDPRPRIVPDEEAQTLQAILPRRRQLLEMLTAENNRLGMAPSSAAVAKRIRAHIK